LIRDATLFKWLEANIDFVTGRDPEALAYAIKRSCENKVGRWVVVTEWLEYWTLIVLIFMHCHHHHHHHYFPLFQAEIVAMDEKEGEAGIRATLNLGHTFGHAVETGLGYGSWLHGEAVAVGTAMAADLSVRLGWIDENLRRRAVELMRRARCVVVMMVRY